MPYSDPQQARAWRAASVPSGRTGHAPSGERRRTGGRPTPVDPVLPRVTPASLTPRQREVLAYVIDGRSTAVIAHLLGITGAAVTRHLREAQVRVEVPSRARLILWALDYAHETHGERYRSRFLALSPTVKGHRRGCPCSVCFVRGRQGRRQLIGRLPEGRSEGMG